jgi:hypothetical protein
MLKEIILCFFASFFNLLLTTSFFSYIFRRCLSLTYILFTSTALRVNTLKTEGGGGGGGSQECLKSAGEEANDDAMEVVLNIQREAHTGSGAGGGVGGTGVGIGIVSVTHSAENTLSPSQSHDHTDGNGHGKDKEREKGGDEMSNVTKPDEGQSQKKEERKKCIPVVSQDTITDEDNTGIAGKTPDDTEIYRNPRETMPVKCKIVDIEAPWTDTEELRRYMIENCITSKSWKRRQKCVNLLCNDDALVQKGSLGKILIDICSAIYLQVRGIEREILFLPDFNLFLNAFICFILFCIR